MARRGAAVIRSGDFDRLVRIEFDTALGVNDSNGNPTDPDWQLFAEAWAKKEPVRGMELRQSMREVSERYEVFSIQYISPLPIEAMTLVDTETGERFDIRDVADVEGARRLLELTCRIVK